MDEKKYFEKYWQQGIKNIVTCIAAQCNHCVPDDIQSSVESYLLKLAWDILFREIRYVKPGQFSGIDREAHPNEAVILRCAKQENIITLERPQEGQPPSKGIVVKYLDEEFQNYVMASALGGRWQNLDESSIQSQLKELIDRYSSSNPIVYVMSYLALWFLPLDKNNYWQMAGFEAFRLLREKHLDDVDFFFDELWEMLLTGYEDEDNLVITESLDLLKLKNIGNRTPPDIVETLCSLLMHPGNEPVARRIALILGHTKSDQVITALLKALQNPRAEVRINAITALVAILGTRAKTYIEHLKSDRSRAVRDKVRETLDRLKVLWIEEIRSKFENDDEVIRSRVEAMLDQNSPDELLRSAVTELESESPQKRYVAVKILEEGDERALTPLRNVLSELLSDAEKALTHILASLPNLRLRMDIIRPDRVYLRRQFKIAIAVRLPASPILTSSELNNTGRSRQQIPYSGSDVCKPLKIQVIAPGFTPIVQEYSLEFSAFEDPPVVFIPLTPNKCGKITIRIELYQSSDSDRLGFAQFSIPVSQEPSDKPHLESHSHYCLGIFPGLNESLRSVLLESRMFDSAESLRGVFSDGRISQWKFDLIATRKPLDRVNQVVDYLKNNYSQTYENALIILLKVLIDQTYEQKRLCKELTELARKLEICLKHPDVWERAYSSIIVPELILVPAGEFKMGSLPLQDAEPEEQPQCICYLPAYKIAKTPITNAQYLQFVRATNHIAPEHWTDNSFPEEIKNHPVVHVSWCDAIDYCRWLAKVTEEPYRLPSEAEWEKAARGTDGRIYPWGDQFDTSRCNTRESNVFKTTPVDAYPDGASPYGVLDMAGNVWEWTASLWDEAPDCESLDSNADEQIYRVVRGGSFNRLSVHARCARRLGNDPRKNFDCYGFRVAVSEVPKPKSIPPSLKQRLCETLTRCSPFENNDTLRHLFTDSRIAPWRNRISDTATTREARVNALIDSLHDQANTQGENALVLFLRVLANGTDPADDLHPKLLTLADELARALTERTPA